MRFEELPTEIQTQILCGSFQGWQPDGPPTFWSDHRLQAYKDLQNWQLVNKKWRRIIRYHIQAILDNVNDDQLCEVVTHAAATGDLLALESAYSPRKASLIKAQRPLHAILSQTALEDDFKSSLETTALCIASSSGWSIGTEYLLTKGADVETPGLQAQNTPLYYGAVSGSERIVRVLLKYHAKINSQASKGRRTALYGVANQWQPTTHIQEMASLLLRNGADPKLRSSDNCTVLHVAAWRGYTEVLKVLVDFGVNIEETGSPYPQYVPVHTRHIKEAYTPLMMGVMHGKFAATQYLLSAGANVHARLLDRFDNPLCLAIRSSHDAEKFVDLLLEYGADLNGPVESEGRDVSPLSVAIEEAGSRGMELLLNRGAELRHANRSSLIVEWMRSSDWTSRHDSPKIIRLLHKHGADVDKNAPLTALVGDWHNDGSIMHTRLPIIETLMDLGADVNKPNDLGYSPLRLVVNSRHMPIQEKLRALLILKTMSGASKEKFERVIRGLEDGLERGEVQEIRKAFDRNVTKFRFMARMHADMWDMDYLNSSRTQDSSEDPP